MSRAPRRAYTQKYVAQRPALVAFPPRFDLFPAAARPVLTPILCVGRDVRSDAPLFFSFWKRLGDFGLAVLRSEWGWEDGDGGYLAPELLAMDHSTVQPTPAVDVFSLGVIMYELAQHSRLPREAEARANAMENKAQWRKLPASHLQGAASWEAAQDPGVAQRCLSRRWHRQ